MVAHQEKFLINEWKFYFVTFGCKVNQHESQIYSEAWRKLGGVEVGKPEDADFICVNSCAITSRAERDARNAINKLRKISPKAKIILTGCAAQFFNDFTPRKKANHQEPDICVVQHDKKLLLSGPFFDVEARPKNVPENNIIHKFKRARAIVKVQDGCKQNCTYCIVPQTRPDLFSEAPKKILEECRTLAENGHAELMISGINLRQYGKDNPEYGAFWDMLAWLDKQLAKDYNGKLRLRVSSVEPSQLNEKALRIFGEAELLCPHLHLSLQHASPKILRDMGRGHYKVEEILEFINKLSRYWPVFALGADIITGFPGESEADFQELLSFVKECPLTYAHVFPYSARQGTVAGKREDQVLQKIRHERAGIVRDQINLKKRAFWQRIRVLPNMYITPELAENSHMTRGVNEFYAPCFLKEIDDSNGLIKVKPVGVIDEGILVERIK